MNDERFIEQLNLYIDRELSADEVTEIEAAIAADPARQRIYAQYCKIERATRQLLNETEIPQPDIAQLVATAREDNTIDFPQPAADRPRRSWLSWGAPLGALAAASLAVVFTIGTMQTAQHEPAAPTVNYAAIPDAPAVETERIPYQTVFVLDADRSDDALPGMVNRHDSFAWMSQVEFEPIERVKLDDWQMRTSAPIEVRSLDPRWLSPVGLDDTPPREAMTAFQFQR